MSNIQKLTFGAFQVTRCRGSGVWRIVTDRKIYLFEISGGSLEVVNPASMVARSLLCYQGGAEYRECL